MARCERKRRFLPRKAKRVCYTSQKTNRVCRLPWKAKQPLDKKKPRLLSCSPHLMPAASRFCFVLELKTASVWDFLPLEDVSNVLRVCSSRLPKDFMHGLAVNAVNQFAVGSQTHLGQCCGCDWMRGLDFHPFSDKKCSLDEPFSASKTIPMLSTLHGAWKLLDALTLTKKLLQPLCSDDDRSALFVPVVCPLATAQIPRVRTKNSIVQAMNEVCRGAGSRFFYNFKVKLQSDGLDSLVEHWDGIDVDNASCWYCDHLTSMHSRNWTRWNLDNIKRVRDNCKKMYRPLKAAMGADLQHLQLIPPPRSSRKAFPRRFEGLVAGIAQGGVLCGFYLVNGFLPY